MHSASSGKFNAGSTSGKEPLEQAAVLALCQKAGMDPDPAQAELLAKYLDLLMSWNRRMNLVGARDWQTALTDLAADSWHLARFLEESSLPDDPLCLDLGAGAGLPGIPLRVFWRTGEYRMVEIREKRVVFLRFALAELDLERTLVDAARAEEVLARHRPVDLVLSRAFMPWPEVLKLVRDDLAEQGRVVIMASDRPPKEAEKPQGFVLDRWTSYPAPGGERYFWLFRPARA